MKLLIKMFIAVLVVLMIFLGIKKYQPSMQAVYPQQCAFLIDEQLSVPFQKTLQAYVTQKYQSCKDVKQILDDISGQFPEVKSMEAYVCRTDHVCFSLDAYKPLFLLNEQIVCNNFKLVQKEHYHDNRVCELSSIKASLLESDPVKIANFVGLVPQEIFQEFDVDWLNDHEIILSQKNKKPDMLVFSATKVPTSQDVALFKQIQATYKNRKAQVYDFRFKDQIVVK